MTLQWVAVDALTLRVLDDLPTLHVDYPLRRSLGQYETGTAHLDLTGAPPQWPRATLPGASVLACFDDTDPDRGIQWAGLVIGRTRGPVDVVDLTLVTLEGYLDRRYVGDRTYVALGQNALVADLIAGFVADTGGIGVTVAYATAGAGQVRDRTYKLLDFTRVYQRMQELMAVQGGPEWTIEWAWSTDGQHLTPTLWVGDRIGTAAPAGLSPAAVFDILTDFALSEDYADSKGATRVTAYSSGSGASTPTSGPRNATDTGGRPVFEHAWQPSSSITVTQTLIDYATKAVAQLAPGSVAVAVTAALGQPGTPRYGTDWKLGDDVLYQIGGVGSDGLDTVRSVPGGISGVGRAVAYEVTVDTISPILAQASLYTAPGG